MTAQDGSNLGNGEALSSSGTLQAGHNTRFQFGEKVLQFIASLVQKFCPKFASNGLLRQNTKHS